MNSFEFNIFESISFVFYLGYSWTTKFTANKWLTADYQQNGRKNCQTNVNRNQETQPKIIDSI